MINSLIQESISAAQGKVVEISIGLAAAALIIDKILKWTLSWKKSDRDQEAEQRDGARMVFDQPSFIRHDAKIDAISTEVATLCRAHEEMKECETEQTQYLKSMKEGGDRRELLLQKLIEKIDRRMR